MDLTSESVTIAAVVIIGAITTAAVKIINALHSTKEAVDAVVGINAAQSKKLDGITVLVDGRYGEVLSELATVKRLLAAESGLQTDQVAAEIAQVTSDKHKELVEEAKASGLHEGIQG
jgi:hypothetical protein